MNNIIVAESDGIVVGFCRYSFIDSLNTDCEIREIYVEPSQKRMGIGSKLFNHVEFFLQSKGCKKMSVGVFTQNHPAKMFYEKMGGKIGKNKTIAVGNVFYDVSTYLWELK